MIATNSTINGTVLNANNISGSSNSGTVTNATTIITNSDNTNTTCYIPFSKTTANNNTALFVDDNVGPLSYNPSTSTLTCTNFNGSVSGVKVEDNNTTLMYPVMIQGTAGDNKQLYADITTTPFSYSASTGTLSTPQLNCTTLNSTGTSPTCNLWNTIVSSNVNMMSLFASGTLNFAPNLSTGTINIATNSTQTTGNINIGALTSTTGACNVFCDLNCSKDVTAPSFIGPATEVLTTSDNSNGSYYIPFIKTGASTNSALFVDDTTGPLTYNPSNGGLTCTVVVCPRYDSSSNTANCSLFGNTATGNIVIGNAITTGSVSIAATGQTTGSVNIGSTTATGAGVVNIRPPLVCLRQIRTTNSNTYKPNSSVLDLGYSSSIYGSSFITNVLAADTITTVASFSFTSANFGTYLFNSSVLITPDDTTGNRQIDSSIAIVSGLEIPYFSRAYVTPSSPQPPTLNVSRVVPIYVSLDIVLTCRCQNSSATILTSGLNGLFTYTRIA